MKILIIGSGGREYAIGYKIKSQNPTTTLFFSPGNGGTMQLGTNVDLNDNLETLHYAKQQKIDLTIVGPEQPLVEGIVDLFNQHNLKILGPHKKAAQLEGSKVFAKNFMHKYGITTAAYKTFTHYVDAKEYLTNANYPLVIKASGLAAGKGVIICNDEFEAQKNIKKIMQDKIFGEAGNKVVIEEFLEGFEASIISIYNGKDIYPMLSAKDHKKIGENETGPNTGGMGVIVPNPLFKQEHYQQFIKNILNPTLEGLQKENLNFSGIIFFGLMITNNNVYLLEYNMRFGDPETQTLLPLLQSNLLEIIKKTVNNKKISLNWQQKKAVCVVMASGGYPLNYEKGFVINGLNKLNKNSYCIAGAKQENQQLITSGGRVLNILGVDDTLENAIENTYKNVDQVYFEYNYYRKDIGKI